MTKRAAITLALAAAAALVAKSAMSADPIALFTEMVPVFTHDRCANCHGGVDPHAESGPLEDTHDGGIIPQGGTCTESSCHTQAHGAEPAHAWRTAAPHHSFGGKSARELCDMQSPIAQRMRPPEDYYHHLNSDLLIDLAFVGQSGGANPSPQPSPPPMRKNDFLKAARAWLDAGAGCGGWVGTITRVEKFGASYSYPLAGMPPPSSVTVTENAERTLTLDRRDGISTVTVNQGGRSKLTQVMHTTGENGPCEITIVSMSTWTGRAAAQPVGVPVVRPSPGASPGVVGRGGFDAQINPDGSYVISFTTPEERTTTAETGNSTTNCGPLPPMNSSDTTELVWDPRHFTIRCPANFTQNPAGGNAIDCDIFDPPRQPRLKGTMTRTIINHEDAADPQSWLSVSPVGNSRADDGTSLPVVVTTTWDFVLVE
jgi:hypothetical protein